MFRLSPVRVEQWGVVVDIKAYIGEATEYDKKEALEDRRPKSWLKSVSAFANGKGGVLIFGVANDGALKGLSDVKTASEKISEAIKSKMDPLPGIDLQIRREDGKEFILLHVSAGAETPYYYIGDGGRIAYIRVGNESVQATAADLKRLVLRGSNSTYDSLSTLYRFENFAFTKLRSVYRQRTGLEMDAQDFLSFGLVDERGFMTHTGALLADESPMRFSRLFCTRWNGQDKASGTMEALDDKEFSGSLIALLQSGEEFVRNNTRKRWKKTDYGRVEMPDYPDRAVLECLVNALIHRDYMIAGSEVHIDIFDDRMEIYSPGGMMDGSLVQELDTDQVPSKRRNPIIADVFSRMNYMERRGSGFRKIKADYHRAVNFREALEPRFFSDRNNFIVTLFNLNYGVEVGKTILPKQEPSFTTTETILPAKKTSIEKKLNDMGFTARTSAHILKLYQHYSYEQCFTRAQIADVLGITTAPATVLIRKMKETGLIELANGKSRGAYHFKKI